MYLLDVLFIGCTAYRCINVQSFGAFIIFNMGVNGGLSTQIVTEKVDLVFDYGSID